MGNNDERSIGEEKQMKILVNPSEEIIDEHIKSADEVIVLHNLNNESKLSLLKTLYYLILFNRYILIFKK